MTQLLLFDPPISTLTVSVSTSQPAAATASSAGRGAVAAPGDAGAPLRAADEKSLRKLAELIQQGRASIPTRSLGQVQRMGDLAQQVLLRHDLVARRRALRCSVERA